MRYKNLVIVIFSLFCLVSVRAQKKQITSPSSVGQQLKEDHSIRQEFDSIKLPLQYDQWKTNFVKRTGFNFGLDYNALYYKATFSPTENNQSASGAVRFYTNWELLGRGTEDIGSLVVKIEHRHAFTSVAPVDFGFELGYVGLLHSTFSNQGFHATNLYWKQTFAKKRILVFAGFMDVTDYVDVHLLASPWTSFSNLVFATGSGTIGILPDGAFGAMAGGWINNNLYLAAGIADANSNPAQVFKGFQTFFEKFETFKSVELGWASDKKLLLFNNMHVTLWQVDARTDAQTQSGWGISASSSITHNKSWMSFLRGGYSHKGNALLESSISIGTAHYIQSRRDVLGIALNWGRPNHFDFPDVDDQWTLETYYLFQLGRHLQITPNIQMLLNPAYSTDRNFIAVGGIRSRFVL